MYSKRASAVFVICLLLCACSKESDRVKKEYEMMLQVGATGQERCTKLRQIADTYLREQNENEYQLAKSEADSACLDAHLAEMEGTTQIYRSQ